MSLRFIILITFIVTQEQDSYMVCDSKVQMLSWINSSLQSQDVCFRDIQILALLMNIRVALGSNIISLVLYSGVVIHILQGCCD